MRRRGIVAATLLISIAALGLSVATARADGNIKAVKHIIIMMQENHSFDNYLGVLPYAPGGPYHPGPCKSGDHSCVDGLTCSTDSMGNLTCSNTNLDADGNVIHSFHDFNYCPGPDLDHGWSSSHREANLMSPAQALMLSLNNGFVVVNNETEQTPGTPDAGDNDTMGFYNQDDLAFYYNLAQTFAIDDRYFCSVVGPTFPNRSYEMAGTSFGHVVTGTEIFPPGFLTTGSSPGYKPITGNIFNLLDAAGITWKNYFEDLPTSVIMRGTTDVSHLLPISVFLAQAAAGTLPQVSFVDPGFAPDVTLPTGVFETDEHPPFNIRAGQFVVSELVNAVRNGPNWNDSVIFLTYDEHGGFYDHVAPPPAPQGKALNPDGINPGQCADASNLPASGLPGGGQTCTESQADAAGICPGFTPTGPYPASCANFNQLGFRVPFIVVSPFAKPHYVSHTVGDHTSLLSFIERRFLAQGNGNPQGKAVGQHQSLTLRDQNADPLDDIFDFNNSPSLNATLTTAPLPQTTEHDCPFPDPPGETGP